MELRFNAGSPFARKVRILVREKQLSTLVTEVETRVSPVEQNVDLSMLNPLGKIPVLVVEGGAALYDSRVICEYLDGLHPFEKALATSRPARFEALQRQATADGISDAAVLCRYELAIRPSEFRWSDWIDGQKRKIDAALSVLERDLSKSSDTFDIGHIAMVSAIGYLDFRLPELQWRAKYPELAAWIAASSQRPSVASTAPV